MSGPLAPGSVIGIIGGGQLGRMLAMAAARLGYRTVILEPQADCPAAQVANQHIVAAYDDAAALAELAKSTAVVTYEFENVPVEAAETLAKSVPVYPPPRALEVSQDRLIEKRFLGESGVPIVKFGQVDSDERFAHVLKELGGEGVLKTRRMGYDGKGQRVFRRGETVDPAGVFQSMGGVPLIMEELVPFEREISVIGVRAIDGSCITYDPAENVHREGILRTSTVPAKISQATSIAAQEYAVVVMHNLNYVGVMGIEFFASRAGLIANEIAPRVHNSGHWTEAACAVSQFEHHIRAIAGLPLVTTKRHSDCVMENLIGDDLARLPELYAEPQTVIHLYGKAESRPGRKMGHLTRIRPIGS
ncbi:MAG TPA: 5-(carboxyamino)imidazole ribonucleotide synthase [Rhizobiaceae bacterium]|nr:5-(carboxyamino)imidazole ribonucleotide synthase [Rhizobiaceae bacterium]